LLQSIQDKIGNDTTNEEVFTEIENDVLPHIDLFGDVLDDAIEGDSEEIRPTLMIT
jgi:hypothetical protein